MSPINLSRLPFSRKRPPKKPTEADIDATNNAIDASEPLLSFNYQATLGIIQIARAVAPIVSMNEGYILTANYDLRTDGERKILGLQMFQSLLSESNKPSVSLTIPPGFSPLDSFTLPYYALCYGLFVTYPKKSSLVRSFLHFTR